MKKNLTRLLSILLALVLTVGMLPVSALADGWQLSGSLERGESASMAESIGTQAANTSVSQPFVNGTTVGSQIFRIPNLVKVGNGALLAAADARWSDYKDEGGIDTLTARTEDSAASWSYTWGAYLGENGTTKTKDYINGTFIDASLAAKGDEVWMLVDLFAEGYSNLTTTDIRKNDAFKVINNEPHLRLRKNGTSTTDANYSYYLGSFTGETEETQRASIYNSSGSAVSEYSVDRWFNLYQNGTKVSNLFSSNAAYIAYPISHLYLTKSNDGGKTWGAPMLLNLKANGELFYGTGPGGATVTHTGRIVFPCYNLLNGALHVSVIYSDDSGKTWTRGTQNLTGSEASISEVNLNGTYYLYMFVRGGKYYYVSADNGTTWSAAKTVSGISYYTGCALSTLTYSKPIDGRPAILLSVPTNSTNKTSGTDAARNTGYIFVGLVQDDGTINWKYSYNVNGTNVYQYSDMAELDDGSIGLLYEDGYQNNAGIAYTNLAIETIAPNAEIGTPVKITVTAPSGAVSTPSSVAMKTTDRAYTLSAGAMATWTVQDETVLSLTAADSAVAAYAASVTAQTVRVTPLRAGSTTVTATLGDETATLAVTVAEPTAAANEKTIELTVGTSNTENTQTGNVTPDQSYDASIVTVGTQYAPGSGTPEQAETITSGEEYYISDGTNFLTLSSASSTTITNTTNASDALKWTITGNASSGYTISRQINGTTYYLYRTGSYNASLTSRSSSAQKWSYSISYGFYYTSGSSQYYISKYNTSGWVIYTTPNGNSYGKPYVETSAEGETAISFTGTNVGQTDVRIGDTLYHVKVNPLKKTITVVPSGTKSTPVTGNVTQAQLDAVNASGFVTVTKADGMLTFAAGAAEKTGTFLLGNTEYTINVTEKQPTVGIDDTPFIGGNNTYNTSGDKGSNSQKLTKLTISADLDFDVDLADTITGTVEWSIEDPTIAEVDQDGVVTGKTAGETVLVATTEDGETYRIPVVVRENPVGDTSTTIIYNFYIEEITDSRAYYVFSCETTMYEAQEGEAIYVIFPSVENEKGGCIDFFAGPKDETYALTLMNAINGTNFFPLHESGSTEVSTKDGYFAGANLSNGTTNYLAYNQKNFFGTDAFTSMTQTAIDNLCDGGLGFTTIGGQTGAISTRMSFRSRRLPTVNKEIISVARKLYTPGMSVAVGEQIVYRITVTQYANGSSEEAITYTYPNTDDGLTEKLDGAVFKDNSKANVEPALAEVVTEDTEYTYDVTYTVKAEDVETIITNTVNWKYTYSAKYSSGAYEKSAEASASISAMNFDPYDIVIDFGRPVSNYGDLEERLKKSGTSLDHDSGSALHGTVTVTDYSVTYTPGKDFPMQEYDIVSFKNLRGGTYSLKVYPASNVLYEENFLTADENSGWTLNPADHADVQETQKAKDETVTYNVFGFDTVYERLTGEAGVWQASDLIDTATNKIKMTGKLTTTFYGNAFDLIGNCGPDTGRVFMVIRPTDPNEKRGYIIDVDTRYSKGTLNQVPLAHVALDKEMQYKVEIMALGLEETTVTPQTNGSAFSVMSARSVRGNEMLRSVVESYGLTMADVQHVSMESTISAASASASVSGTSRVAAFSAAPQADTITHEAGTHVEIDSFRVYRSSDSNKANSIAQSYPTAEQDVTYMNILDVVKDETITAYTEGGNVEDIEVSKYEAAGGPQNEIYLSKDQAISFQITGLQSIQVSLRAVEGTAAEWATSTAGGTPTPINTNTEMYYTVTADAAGIFTIANRGEKLLAIGNVKLPNGVTTDDVTPASEIDEQVLLQSLRAAFGVSEVEPEPDVFEPDTFDANVSTLRMLRNKLVTIRISVSSDVSYVTVNGVKYWPSRAFSWQRSRTIQFRDTIGRNESKTYTIVAYDANGAASAPITVNG